MRDGFKGDDSVPEDATHVQTFVGTHTYRINKQTNSLIRDRANSTRLLWKTDKFHGKILETVFDRRCLIWPSTPKKTVSRFIKD